MCLRNKLEHLSIKIKVQIVVYGVSKCVDRPLYGYGESNREHHYTLHRYNHAIDVFIYMISFRCHLLLHYVNEVKS